MFDHSLTKIGFITRYETSNIEYFVIEYEADRTISIDEKTLYKKAQLIFKHP